jgi:hypothetical protein
MQLSGKILLTMLLPGSKVRCVLRLDGILARQNMIRPSIASMVLRKGALKARFISRHTVKALLCRRLESEGLFPVRISAASSTVIMEWRCFNRAVTAEVAGTSPVVPAFIPKDLGANGDHSDSTS